MRPPSCARRFPAERLSYEFGDVLDEFEIFTGLAEARGQKDAEFVGFLDDDVRTEVFDDFVWLSDDYRGLDARGSDDPGNAGGDLRARGRADVDGRERVGRPGGVVPSLSLSSA